MEKRLTIRMPEALHLRLAALAERTDLGLAETGRALIERGLSAPTAAGGDAPAPTEILSALLVAQDEQAAELKALAQSVGSINETLRDLALAVQKLYQPAPRHAAANTPAAPAGGIAITPPKPPAYTVWAAGQPHLAHEDRETRIARLKQEYKTQFGISP